MQVTVFISDVDGNAGGAPRLLILPADSDAAIPPNLRSYEWTYFSTTTTEDKLIGGRAGDVEKDLLRDGYAVVTPAE